MPIPQTEAKAVLQEFARDYPGARELTYHFGESIDEFGESIVKLFGEDAAEALADTKGVYLPGERLDDGSSYPGDVIVPLWNIDDADDLLETLRHEVLGHYGADTFAPDEKRALLDGIIAAREQPGIKDSWEDVNRWYAGTSIYERAEEVLALYCETLEPGQHLGQTQVHERGQKSFMETCIECVRPMGLDDLHNILCMVAQGLHDLSRRQQNFSDIDESLRKDEVSEPNKPFHKVVAEKQIEQLKAGTAPWQKPWQPGEQVKTEAQQAPAAGVVLPRISEFRIGQAEKTANSYEDAMQKLWKSSNLPNVRKEIETRAQQIGLSVEDVIDKMTLNGEMPDLHEKFRSAVAESPDAKTHKKAMDKALNGWVRQYGRAQEELLNLKTEGDPLFESLRDRLDHSHGRMQKNTANAPLFEGEDKSHAQKRYESTQRIMEKLKDLVSMGRVNKGADAQVYNDPSP